ncbi:MAG: CHAT domain-containing protein [Acidobacteria bacterium]|nr:CHAT domain-containing protein [Acidobacteriota bacterium]
MSVCWRRSLLPLGGGVLLFFLACHPVVIAAQSFESLESEARTAFGHGKFETGITALTKLLAEVRRGSDIGKQAGVLFLLAEGYEGIGNLEKEIQTLEEILKLVASVRDPEQLIRTYDRLSTAYRRMGQEKQALDASNRALKLAKEANRRDLQAVVLNDLGSIQAEIGNLDAALGSYEESIGLAQGAKLGTLQCAARINKTQVLIQQGILNGLEDNLMKSLDLAMAMPDSYAKALCLLSIGSQYWSSQWRFGLPPPWRVQAYIAYRNGFITARNIGNRRLLSHAAGSIGRLYEDEARCDEALHYTRQAIFYSQEAAADDIAYLWEWQAARNLRNCGNMEQAIALYRQAIRSLGGIRAELTRSGASFQRYVGPVFREMADILLQRASAGKDRQATQRDLLEVRTTLEQLKQAEVAEYFRDDCVVQTQKSTQLDQLSPYVASIYPVILDDRTELLVSLPGGIEEFSVPVKLQELSALIRKFRQEIETLAGGDDFMQYSQRLYKLLIAPLADSLVRDKITTLVFIPDGPLRTIPLSALHDGKSFLIEKYSIVTTPGLSLTSSQPITREDVRTLAGGLTQSVQGLSPLPNVAEELASIESIFATTRMQDSNFVTARIGNEVSEGDYSIVHFATHGHFDSDYSKSFLATFDGQITMDGLQDTIGRRRYREAPLELMVLSACQTAAGDDRAALGLAGVGIKAGARSVLASIWSISDESTAMLISEFYRQLKDAKITKAEALQNAQKSLLAKKDYRHPYYWAPFLLLGNWF